MSLRDRAIKLLAGTQGCSQLRRSAKHKVYSGFGKQRSRVEEAVYAVNLIHVIHAMFHAA